jgi:Lon-like protease
MRSRPTTDAAASANAHVVTKVEVVEEIATSGDTVAESVLPPPGAAWAPPTANPSASPPPSTPTTTQISDPPVPPSTPWVAPSRPAPRARKWGWPFALLGGLLLAFVAIATWIPTNRYAIAPGSASPVAPRLDLSSKIYDSKGKILFVTVGIPKLSLLGRIVGSIDPDVSVKTAREVFGDQSREQNRQQNLKLMSYSKEIAAYVALKRLGYHVGLTGGGPVIQSLCMQFQDENDPKSACVKESPADAVLDPGDAIVAVDGHPVVLPEDIAPLLAGKAPGDTVTVTIYPNGSKEKKDVTVPLTSASDGRTIIGFIPVDGGIHDDIGYNLPVTASISSDQIGGPSAGLAFTLTMIDELTPGDITGGHKVAATGAINIDGSVGDIGGLRQKTVAVKAAGADYFLVPADQVKDAADEAKGSSLKVIPVHTVDEALTVLANLGGDVSGIPAPPAA